MKQKTADKQLLLRRNALTAKHSLLVTMQMTCPGTKVRAIDGLQSIPRESNDKDVAAMLDELTIETNEESFAINMAAMT